MTVETVKREVIDYLKAMGACLAFTVAAIGVMLIPLAPVVGPPMIHHWNDLVPLAHGQQDICEACGVWIICSLLLMAFTLSYLFERGTRPRD